MGGKWPQRRVRGLVHRGWAAPLFDFHDDIYGMRAVVETVAYLRGEVRFNSVDELRSQLKRDRQRSIAILSQGL